jgi:tripartite-type tricarboxylate transporter receptor subunit TctC
MNRRDFVSTVVASSATLASHAAFAQSFPVKPIRLVVGYPPGGSTDIVARLVADGMSKVLGQTVVVENKPGAAGQVASAFVAKAEPDGYTLLATNLGPAAVAPALNSKLPYHPIADFSPISLTGIVPLTLSTGVVKPYRSVGDVIAAAQAKPGSLNFATTGSGSFSHVVLELFNQSAGIKAVAVAYKGGAEVNTAAVTGDIDYFVGSPSDIMSLVKAGRIRMLGITTSQRSPLLPDMPTIAEAGLPGFSVEYWNGIMAPAKTPASVVNALHRAIVAALETADAKARLAALVVMPAHLTPGEFTTMLQMEVAKWSKVVQTAGIKAE